MKDKKNVARIQAQVNPIIWVMSFAQSPFKTFGALRSNKRDVMVSGRLWALWELWECGDRRWADIQITPFSSNVHDSVQISMFSMARLLFESSYVATDLNTLGKGYSTISMRSRSPKSRRFYPVDGRTWIAHQGACFSCKAKISSAVGHRRKHSANGLFRSRIRLETSLSFGHSLDKQQLS